MKAKRILILAIALISCVTIYAQPGGGGMGGGQRGGGMSGGQMGGGQMGGGQNENRGPIDFVAATGLFVIDAEPVIKKCKIKDQATLAEVNRLIGEYQKSYYDITFEHSSQIDTLNSLKPSGEEGEQMSAPTERPNMQNLGIIMQALREKTIPMHNKLKAGMKAALSEKVFKKWEAYYADICEDNSFSEKMPQRGNREQGGQNSQSRQGGMSGGMRQGGGGGRM